jgi:hypothetical protein
MVVDDGSTDETPRILHEESVRWGATGSAAMAGGRAPLLAVVRLDPGVGIAGALAAAARAAGDVELLARQDADDRSRPERLSRQVEFLDMHPEIGLVATGVRTVPLSPDPAEGPEAARAGPGAEGAEAAARAGAEKPVATEQAIGAVAGPAEGWRRYERWLAACVTPEDIARGLWIESPLPHPTVMMRRTAYERAGGYRAVPWAEDYDLWLRMLRSGIAMAKLPEPLYEWADHPGRATRTLPAYSPEAFHACRAHHLARHLEGRGVIVWGAGRDGRRAARAMLRQGVDIRAFLDIDPRKIGRTAHGRPILAAEEWLATRENASGALGETVTPMPIVLAAVGTAGARELIRARLVAARLREGPDFLCIA